MKSSDLKVLGETIKAQREEKKLTLREFAKRTNISFSQLSKIERGEHRPTRETLNKLANYIDTHKVKLYLMAGYAVYSPIDSIHGIDEQISNNFNQVELAKESATHYRLEQDWNQFIQKMKLQNLSPTDVEEIIENYNKIQLLVLKK